MRNVMASRYTAAQAPKTDPSLLRELVAYLRQQRTELRAEWGTRISAARLLRVMTPEEIFSEVTAVYDNYVDALETGSVETLQDYARDLSERIIARGVDARALDPRATGAQSPAHPADHRRTGFRPRTPAHRPAARSYSDEPRQGRRDRHHRCADYRRDRREPPRPDGEGVPAHGGARDHHRTLVGDRERAR